MIRTALVVSFLLLLAACTDSKPKQQSGATAVSSPTAVRASTPPPSTPTANAPEPDRGIGPSAQDLEPEPPRADSFDLARRYRGLDQPRVALTQPPPAQVGDSRRFFVMDLEGTKVLEASATLLARTEHADIWGQDGQRFSRTDAERAGQDFESQVYPQVTADFGLPAPSPDGSPGRIAIIHTSLRGAGGYFSSGDQLPRVLAPFSNEQQVVYLDLNAARPGEKGYAGLLAHEFQHLVHQQRNPYADTWINEGLSEVADELLGGANAYLRRFETSPDIELDAWPPDSSTAAHYGAAHSFLRYVLRHYGGVERAKDLSGEGSTGVNAVERYLRQNFNTGFFDVFADWTVADLLDEEGDGRYSQPDITHRVRGIQKLPASGNGDETVSQLGADYLQISPDGRDVTLRFDGGERVAPVNVSPTSGKGFWWSGRGDAMDATLTRAVDLSGVSSATLRYKLWYSIERDYDYAYVSVSIDGGRTWTALKGRQSTDRDPLKVAYGPGYSGTSGGASDPAWVDESVDLSPYAGRQVLLRFEYVTDEATTLDGIALDDLSIAEIGWRDDAETDGDWQASGFRRVTDTLPQRFIVQLVEQDEHDAATVHRIDLDTANDAEVRISRTDKKATLVVSGATLGTTLPASYRWEVRR